MTEHREFYRKRLTSPGFLIQPSGEVEFQVKDLSLDGFQGHFDSIPVVEEGAPVRIRLPALELERSAMVVRITPDPRGGAQVGFLFLEPAGRNPVFQSLPSEELPDEDDLKF